MPKILVCDIQVSTGEITSGDDTIGRAVTKEYGMSFTFEWDEEKAEKPHGKNVTFMSTASPNETQYAEDDDLRPEYDFSNAVRGKHYRPLHEGYTIKIHKADGTTEVQQVMFEPGTVRIDPDVQAYFPDAQSVNRALRSLMSIMEHIPDATKKKRRSRAKRKTTSQHEVAKSP